MEDLIEFFLKMIWLMGFGVTVREIMREEIKKELPSQQILPKSYGSSGTNDP